MELQTRSAQARPQLQVFRIGLVRQWVQAMHIAHSNRRHTHRVAHHECVSNRPLARVKYEQYATKYVAFV